MAGVPIGWVTRYYGDLHVAVLALHDVIRVGNWLHIVGYASELVERVVSLEINHRSVQEAGPGQEVALRLSKRPHMHDAVYRLTIEKAREHEGDPLLSQAG